MADPKEMIAWVRVNYEHHFKAANLLLAGHGAGIIGCFTVIKDWKNPNETKGIGIFIILFGLGLLTAIINYIFLEFGRQLSMVAARRGTDADNAQKIKLARIYTSAMTISVGLMCLAILVLIVRFWAL